MERSVLSLSGLCMCVPRVPPPLPSVLLCPVSVIQPPVASSLVFLPTVLSV